MFLPSLNNVSIVSNNISIPSAHDPVRYFYGFRQKAGVLTIDPKEPAPSSAELQILAMFTFQGQFPEGFLAEALKSGEPDLFEIIAPDMALAMGRQV